jgi:hypothetical protein
MLEELDGVKFLVAVNCQHLKKYFPSMSDDGPSFWWLSIVNISRNTSQVKADVTHRAAHKKRGRYVQLARKKNCAQYTELVK